MKLRSNGKSLAPVEQAISEFVAETEQNLALKRDIADKITSDDCDAALLLSIAGTAGLVPQNGTVTPSATNFATLTDSADFEPEAVTLDYTLNAGGRINTSTGAWEVNAAYATYCVELHFLACVAGQTYEGTKYTLGTTGAPNIIFYTGETEGDFLSSNTTSVVSEDKFTFVPPAGATHFRLSGNSSSRLSSIYRISQLDSEKEVTIDGQRIKDIADHAAAIATKISKGTETAVVKIEDVTAKYGILANTYLDITTGEIATNETTYADYLCAAGDNGTDGFIDILNVVKIAHINGIAALGYPNAEERHVWFDANKAVIAGYDHDDYTAEYYMGNFCHTYTPPEGARYVKLCHNPVAYFSGVDPDNWLLYRTVTEFDVDNLRAEDKPLRGKKVLLIGDSIIGQYRSIYSISYWIEQLTGATVYNCGIGGTTATPHATAKYIPFSGYALADALATGVWTTQDANIGDITDPTYTAQQLTLIKSLDLTEFDYIIPLYGTNDWSAGKLLNNEADADDYNYYKGALRYMIDKILTAFPHLKMILVTPPYRWWMDGSYIWTEDSDTKVNGTSSLKLTDFVDAVIDVAKETHVGYADCYYTLGINKQTRLHYFRYVDGTHPYKNGLEAIARRIVSVMLTMAAN